MTIYNIGQIRVCAQLNVITAMCCHIGASARQRRLATITSVASLEAIIMVHHRLGYTYRVMDGCKAIQRSNL